MDDDRQQTSLTLIQRLRANEPDAWARMVALYRPLVCYWCGRHGLTGADVDDVVQEVFQVATARLSDFRRDRPGDTFRGWLRGITRWKARDHHRDSGKHAAGVGGSTAMVRLQDLPVPEVDEEEAPTTAIAGLLRRAVEFVR